MEKEIEKLDKDIAWCKIKRARNADSDYWEIRLKQFESEKRGIRAKFDSIFSYVPDTDTEAWIERESSKYGIGRTKETDEYGKAWTVEKAVRELWNIPEVTAKKLTGIIITAGVELGIIMLALLSNIGNNEETFNPNGKVRLAYKMFGQKSITSFVNCAADCYFESGEPPRANTLSRKNREIRKFIIEKFTKDELDELFSSDGKLLS